MQPSPYMAEYAITYFETCEKEADFKKMLLENPVPDNREQIQKLDSFRVMTWKKNITNV